MIRVVSGGPGRNEKPRVRLQALTARMENSSTQHDENASAMTPEQKRETKGLQGGRHEERCD